MRYLPGVDGHHDIVLAGDGSDGEAVAQRLGIGDQVCLNAKVLLRSAFPQAETGLDLVHDHHDAVLVAQLADFFQEAGRGGDTGCIAHHRLEHDRGEIARCARTVFSSTSKSLKGRV